MSLSYLYNHAHFFHKVWSELELRLKEKPTEVREKALIEGNFEIHEQYFYTKSLIK